MAFNKVAQKDSKIFTVDPITSKRDIKRIYDYFIKQDLEKYAILFLFGVYTGLRASDITQFKVKELYLADRVQIREQKTGKIKGFALNPVLKPLLNKICEGRDPEEYVFDGKTKFHPLDRSQVYRRLNEAAVALKIPGNIGTHTMRKTFGYHHYKQHNDVVTLQKIFNHTSPDVTLRYIGITQEEIDRTYLTLNLDPDFDPLENLKMKALCDSRNRSVRVRSFCTSYIKNGGQQYKPFAEMVLELLFVRRIKGGKGIKGEMFLDLDDELVI